MPTNKNIVNFPLAIKTAVWSILANVHTAMPGEIVDYDPETVTATIEPSVKRKMANGEILTMPLLNMVPILFPRTADFGLTFPLKKGDGVLVIFSERALDTWWNKGKGFVPATIRKFDLSDGIAIPGLFTKNNGIAADDKLRLKFKDVFLETDGDDFTLTNGSAIIKSDGGSIDINDGNLRVTQ